MRGHLLSAVWSLAKANVFWLLHAGHACFPGRCNALGYSSYRANSALLLSRSKRKTETYSSDFSVNEAEPAKRDNSTSSEACAQQTVAGSCSGHEQLSAAGAETSREHDCGSAACNPCVDPCIASSARALTVTRSARLSDRHVRGLRIRGKHIGFVVDSGCTFHIHPHLQDLINTRPCTESVSGVDGRPRPCVAVGDLPLTVRNSNNKLLKYTLTG
eukprot:47686-Pleurochrysis_carterae.AAC.1